MQASCQLALGIYDENGFQSSADTYCGSYPFRCLFNGCTILMTQDGGILQRLKSDLEGTVKVVLDFETDEYLIMDLQEKVIYRNEGYSFKNQKIRFYINFWSNNQGEQLHVEIQDMF